MILKPIRWLVPMIICACCVPAGAGPVARAGGGDRLLLALNNAPCGYLEESSGGGVSAQVVREPKMPQAPTKSHIGLPIYEPFRVKADFGLSPEFYNWIAASWTTAPPKQSGSIATLTQVSAPVSERKFEEALITETTIPACDSASKDAGYLTVTFQPSFASDAAPGAAAPPAFSASNSKTWFPSNFKLEIDGLDCAGVTKIDSFTIKRATLSDDAGGDERISLPIPGDLVFAPLHITLSEAGAATWKKWADDFIVKGVNHDQDEKNGRLVFLSGDRQHELARIELKHVGIFRLTRAVTTETTGRFAADLYCEQMILVCPGSGANPAAPAEAAPAEAAPAEAAPADAAQAPTPDGQLGTVYNMGGENPLYFSLKSAEFTTSQVNIGDKLCVPIANEKLLFLHFTVQNPNKAARVVRWDSLKIAAAADANKAIYPCSADWGNAIGHSRLDLHVEPDQTVEGYTVITLPAKGPVTRLTVRATDTSSLLTYDMREKVSGLSEPIAEPEDHSGATAREVVTGEFDTAYPYQNFDVAVGKREYTTNPILGVAPEKGGRYLVVSLMTKNKTMLDAVLRFDTFTPRLTSSKGEPLRYGRNLLVVSADRAFNGNVQPGAETRVRIYFAVPEGAKPETLTLQEGKSRQYTFKIAN